MHVDPREELAPSRSMGPVMSSARRVVVDLPAFRGGLPAGGGRAEQPRPHPRTCPGPCTAAPTATPAPQTHDRVPAAKQTRRFGLSAPQWAASPSAQLSRESEGGAGRGRKDPRTHPSASSASPAVQARRPRAGAREPQLPPRAQPHPSAVAGAGAGRKYPRNTVRTVRIVRVGTGAPDARSPPSPSSWIRETHG
jgi:hypothetical protein